MNKIYTVFEPVLIQSNIDSKKSYYKIRVHDNEFDEEKPNTTFLGLSDKNFNNLIVHVIENYLYGKQEYYTDSVKYVRDDENHITGVEGLFTLLYEDFKRLEHINNGGE